MIKSVIFINDDNMLSLIIGDPIERTQQLDGDFIFIQDDEVTLYKDSSYYSLGRWLPNKFDDYVSYIGIDRNSVICVGTSGYMFKYEVLKEMGIKADTTTIKRSCSICKYRIWLSPLVTNFFCINNKNKDSDIANKGIMSSGCPILPVKGFVCSNFDLTSNLPDTFVS